MIKPVKISKKIESNPELRNHIVADAWVKVGKKPRQKQGRLDIEITDIRKIEANGQIGVEVFARAWQDGRQIGFGRDGTVDIERFRFFGGLPFMVSDGTFTKKTKELPDGKAEEYDEPNLKEDVEATILEQLEHAVSVKKEKSDGSAIVLGKVGSTTSTFYPAAGANSPVDGAIRYNNYSNATWATIRGSTDYGPNGDLQVSATNEDIANLYSSSDYAKPWYRMVRSFFLFDTSALSSAATITSATFSFYATAKTDNFNQGISLIGSTPASNNNLVSGDFDQIGTTQYASDLDITSISTSAYNAMSLNATGIAAVSLTGITKFGVRLSGDRSNTEPSWVSTTGVAVAAYFADNSTNKPKLVVEHSLATNIKTGLGLAKASVKGVLGLAIANVKSINDLS